MELASALTAATILADAAVTPPPTVSEMSYNVSSGMLNHTQLNKFPFSATWELGDIWNGIWPKLLQFSIKSCSLCTQDTFDLCEICFFTFSLKSRTRQYCLNFRNIFRTIIIHYVWKLKKNCCFNKHLKTFIKSMSNKSSRRAHTFAKAHVLHMRNQYPVTSDSGSGLLNQMTSTI